MIPFEAVETIDELLLSPADEGETLERLAETLRLSQRFLLIFVQIDSPADRTRLIQRLQEMLPEKPLLQIPLYQQVNNLYQVMEQQEVPQGTGAVCVYGMERWLIAGKVTENSPFIRNINFTRSHFAGILPCPLVLWLPEYILRAIQQGAKDFFSISSGLFTFVPTNNKDVISQLIPQMTNFTAVSGLSPAERDNQIAYWQKVLHEQRQFALTPLTLRNIALLITILGNLYYVQADYDKAQACFHEALSICRHIMPPEHPDIATNLNSLALTYKAQAHYIEAEALLLEALNIDRKLLPPNHPSLAAHLNNLAVLYDELGEYDKAEPLLLEALAISRKGLPHDHPDLAIRLNNLAGLYEIQKRFIKAEELYLEALAISRKALPPSHPDLARTLNNIAALYQRQTRFIEAEPLILEALQIIRQALGENHPNTQTLQRNVQYFYQAWEKHKKKPVE